MKALSQIQPTREQLALISNTLPGVQLIRGAAGSGKTTTALLMLHQLSDFWLRRRERLQLTNRIEILVITFNRTLRGYIEDLAKQQIKKSSAINLEVSTFAKWAMGCLPPLAILVDYEREAKIKELSATIPLSEDFVIEEVDYILGRFPINSLAQYVTCKRIGRGTSPRVEGNLRQRLMDVVVHPYLQWKSQIQKVDWNDVAFEVSKRSPSMKYDIIIADEAQDLSANQVRAIKKVAADPSSVVFILDAAQRIYPRGFTWAEAGVTFRRIHRLHENHRNTKEICSFALPLLDGLEIGDDGTFPDFHSCKSHGSVPVVIKGLYSQQTEYVLNHIKKKIDLSSESVAFLKPRGGSWFDHLRESLRKHSLDYIELTRQSEWPTGSENIALSTMHSAKGLEFDHVFILGLNDEVTPHGEDHGDTALENFRRMLAMAITRARKSVITGYKPGEASILVSFLDPATYREESL